MKTIFPRKRVLIVNCYIDELHELVGRPFKVPSALTPAYLAGAFAPDQCDVRLYNEHTHGPLNDRYLLGWPDLLVVTGLTSAFDRMRHLAAYARTFNPKVVVAAGGPAIRALPRYSSKFFDYSCTGDIEELREVAAEVLGRSHVADSMLPRFDLVNWMGRFGYVETSRNCNFRCSFCSLTGEGVRYQSYSLDYIRAQIVSMGKKKKIIIFLDNNFYGNDRDSFHARLELLKEMRADGWFQGWAALVTNDFFLDDDNLNQAHAAGCASLFSGVESLDVATLRSFSKLQNTRIPQTEIIRKCLEAGILFNYGLILDVTSRTVAQLRAELEHIIASPELTLPSFLSLPIPLLRTPFFRESLANGLLLPRTRLCDLNGSTLALKPLDPLDKVARFVRDFRGLRGYRLASLRHAFRFLPHYLGVLGIAQLAGAFASVPLLWDAGVANAPFGSLKSVFSRPQRTHVSTTEPLHPIYRPVFQVASRYAHYFEPTLVTDAAGRLSEPLCDDLLPSEVRAPKCHG